MTAQQTTIPKTEKPTDLSHPENKNIVVKIKAKDYIKLRSYVDQVNTEVSGFARVDSLPDGQFLVSNFKIFEQINTSTHTEMKEKSISDWTLQAVKDDLDTNKELKCWWHSHCQMNVFWSGIDESQIERLDTQLDEDNWKLSLETNHAGDLIARLDVYFPARYTVAGLTVKIDYSDEEVYAESKEELDEKCEEYKIPRYKYDYRNYHSYPQYSKKKVEQVDLEEWEEWERELQATETKKTETNRTIQKANQMSSIHEIQNNGWNRNVYPHQKEVQAEIPDEVPTSDFEKEMEEMNHNQDEPPTGQVEGQQVLLPQNSLSLENLDKDIPDPQSEKMMEEAWQTTNPDPKIWIPERGD